MPLRKKFASIIGISLLSSFLAVHVFNTLFLRNTGTGMVFFVSVALVAVVLGIVVLIYIEKLFIRPTALMIEGVEYVRTKKEPSPCLKVEGCQELRQLGESINNLLEDLKTTQQELKESETRYKYLSFTDTLTGLYNRAYFEYEMKRLNENLKAYLPLSIISVDIDRHKIVNDIFGHQAGDKQLKHVADILKTSIRKEDTLARIGGDEFNIILPNVSYKLAQERREKIMEAVEEHNKKNPSIPLSISVGVATSEEKNWEENIYDIQHKADDNMYYYKFNKTAKTTSRITDLFLCTLAERDCVSKGHLERMAVLSQKVAERMGLNKQEKEDLILTARLHDLGYLEIPDEILFKPGKLTQAEMNKIRTHVNIGYNIACRTRELTRIAEYILYHHEWWDGNGYPARLKGEEIPFVCRIISILDAYDTMTNPRPYRNGIAPEDAMQELCRQAGSQFDPELVRQFIEIMREEDILQANA